MGGNMLQAAAFFVRMGEAIEHSRGAGLEEASRIIEDAAKAAIGDPGNGFGWPPLAESTLARKAANTPLYETGKLQASISHVVEGHQAAVGSNEDTAVWQHEGTSRIPPRPFLTPAVIQNLDKIEETIGKPFHAVLSGRSVP